MTYTSHVKEVNSKFDKSCRRAVEAGAHVWRNGILQTLTGNRHGRTYFVPGTHKEYTASAPGEAPASVTGDLRTSYDIKVISDTEAHVGTPLKKAVYLEYGTEVDGVQRMAPRPHFWISAEKNEAAIKKAIEDELKGI